MTDTLDLQLLSSYLTAQINLDLIPDRFDQPPCSDHRSSKRGVVQRASAHRAAKQQSWRRPMRWHCRNDAVWPAQNGQRNTRTQR